MLYLSGPETGRFLGHGLEELSVNGRECVQLVAVDVYLAHHLASCQDRDYYLRLRRQEALKVPRVLRHVGYYLRLPGLRREPADSLADGDADVLCRGRARPCVQDEVFAIDSVDPNPGIVGD